MKKNRSKSKKVVLAAAISAALLLLCGAMYFITQGGAKAETTVINDVFADGIYIMNIDMSGKTKEQALELLNEAITKRNETIETGIIVDGTTYELKSEQLGVTNDVENIIDEALSYSKSLRSTDTEDAAMQQKNFKVSFSYDINAISSVLREYSNKIDIQAENAAVDVQKNKDESRELTGTEIAFTEGEHGRKLDIDATAEALISRLEKDDFSSMAAILEVTEPDYSKADLESLYEVIGTYETTYSDSKPNRRFNIWKMADAINGVRIEPGKTWSINEQAGPRTNERGYKDAPGITNGELVDQPGGGICQVSSTLYNAVIRAELEIVEKYNHSWRQGYTDGGLDATISTDWPDFKFANNKDNPVFILVDCDGENRKIRVSIYGPRREDGMTIGFSSEKIDEFRDKPEKTIEDPTLPAGERKIKQQERIGEVYQVYKHWYNEKGDEIKIEPYEKVTYKYNPAIVYVGTMPVETMPEPVVVTPEEAAPVPIEAAPTPIEETPAPPTEASPDPVQE